MIPSEDLVALGSSLQLPPSGASTPGVGAGGSSFDASRRSLLDRGQARCGRGRSSRKAAARRAPATMAVRRRCDSCRVQIRRGRLLGGWVHAGRRRCCGAAARLGQHFVVRRTALFAGRAVHRPARVSSASPSHAHPAAVCAANGWRRPSDEQTQRCVVSTFVRPLGQRVRMNGAEHRPSAGLDHGHNDLGSARRGEHDPVARGPAGGRRSLVRQRVRGPSTHPTRTHARLETLARDCKSISGDASPLVGEDPRYR